MFVSTTTMSSRGQIVIPEAIRNSLGLETGAQFVVVGENDSIILKSISAPSIHQFKSLMLKAQAAAKKAKMKRKDLQNAIKKVRAKK